MAQALPFGARLRRLRIAAGLTQEQLAERAGLSPNAVGQLERGERMRPYPHTIAALADALALPAAARSELIGGVADAPRTAPPTPLPATPPPATPLVGRDDDLRQLADLLVRLGVRLLTLTGPAGVGKTTLALALAADPGVAAAFPDGAAFVSLAAIADPDLALPTVAAALGIRPDPARPLKEALVAHLRPRRLLLVLDNLEHLPAVALEIAALVAACPRLAVVATSRSPLRVRAERSWPVAPLAVPALDAGTSVAAVAASPAVRLFADRAAAVDPGFALSDANAGAVAAICRRLDGLPLAIELAAARVRLLPPTALLGRLHLALPLLVDGPRDLPERQRTMRSAIAWSDGLLDASARALFRRLSVFAGGFTLDAAEQVGGWDNAATIVSDLGHLVDHALVLAEIPPGRTEARYRMLEPVREYAAEQLQAAGEEPAARSRHAAALSRLAERAARELWGIDQIAWLDLLETDNDNLRSGLGWLLEQGMRSDAAAMVWALWPYWWWRGGQAEGAGWAERVLADDEAEPLSPVLGARVRIVLAAMLYRLGGPEPPAVLYAQALARLPEDGPTPEGALAHLGLGVCLIRGYEVERGETLVAAAATEFRQLGSLALAAYALTTLGIVPFNRGDYASALARFEEGLALARRSGAPLVILFARYDVALAAHALGDRTRSKFLYREGLADAVALGEPLYVAYHLEGLAAVAAGDGDRGHAARLGGAAQSRLDRLGVPVDARGIDFGFLVDGIERARADDGVSWDADWAAGATLPDELIVAEALGGAGG